MTLPRIYPLWSINDRLDLGELCRQLREFKRLGYDGVIFHPRFYPNDPPYLGPAWMEILSNLILDAQDAGMEFWIYDENGWPSGSCGGELLKKFPEAKQYWVEMDGQPKICRGDYLDMLDPHACRHFIDLTYERYKSALDPRAFEHVAGFFTDEPQYGPIDGACASPHGFVPWTHDLPRRFRERHGHDLQKDLPLLFFNGTGAGELRIKFWELVTDLHHEAFHRPLNRWCQAHGKQLTGHVKGEEHPLFQLMYAGSCPRFFQTFSLPGIDSRERKPNNEFAALELRTAARQKDEVGFVGGEFAALELRTAARRFGNGHCMVEAFGGAGWGAGPEDLLNHLACFADLGVTHFVLHQSQYRLKSDAVVDWPPSIPFHVPWRESVPDVFRELRKRVPPPPAKVLLVAPHREIMANYEPWVAMRTNIHNGSTYPDCAAGQINTRFLKLFQRMRETVGDFDITDERTVEQFGHAQYETVITDEAQLPAGTRITPPVRIEQRVILNGSPKWRVAAGGGPRMMSASPFEDGPAGTLRTAGPFRQEAYAPPDPADLIRCGFPFAAEPVVVEAALELPALRPGMVLHLPDCRAAAAGIVIDGALLGWAWSPSWRVTVETPIQPGRHVIQIRLAPSGLNF